MQAVILAAGKGKRLQPITIDRPKAMVPVVGKPVIERVVETLSKIDVHTFIIVVNPKTNEIKNHFSTLKNQYPEMIFVEQIKPLGMGHALQQAAPFIVEDFILSSCDNLVDPKEISSLVNFWEGHNIDGLLTSILVDSHNASRMGILMVENDKVIRIVEKPPSDQVPSNIGSTPLYIFSPIILNIIKKIPQSPRGEFELQDAIQLLINQGKDVRVFRLTGRSDLTNPQDLLDINREYLIQGKYQRRGSPENSGKRNTFIPPFYIEDGVTLGSECVIGPNVYIESGCVLGDNIQLQDVVILRDRYIESNTMLENQLLW